MLRLLCLVACLLFVNTVIADNKYIRVVGEGTTVEQAKEDAFRTAVQQRAGAIVLSERQANLGKLDKDNISLFSAGYVDDFKIIDINQSGSNIKITLDVLVADSKLLNQVVSTGKTAQGINGDKASVALGTYLDQKQKGDNLLNVVMRTYPQNAFIVKQLPYILAVDSYRNTVFQIPYSMKWNYDYIVAFNEAMSLVEDNVGFMQQAPSNVIVMAKNPKDFLLGKKNYYKINDIPILTRIKDAMTYDREVRIQLIISENNGTVLYHTCYVPDSINGRKNSFYDIGDPRLLTVNGNEVESGVLRAMIDPAHNYVVQRAGKIEVSVVPNSSCPR